MTTSTVAPTKTTDTSQAGDGRARRRWLTRRNPEIDAAAKVRLGRFGIGTAGVVAILASAWGGIVPYVGPVFGFSGDGSASWHWNLAHGVLALAPGIAGVLLGLFVLVESRGITVGKGRLSLATAGTLLMVCGAWFAIGPLAWPVLSNSGAYFVGGTHLRVLAYEAGYSIGTGFLLVVCGAFVDGWASRHQRKATVVAAPSHESDMAAGRAESGI
jgi:hypothetical protein